MILCLTSSTLSLTKLESLTTTLSDNCRIVGIICVSVTDFSVTMSPSNLLSSSSMWYILRTFCIMVWMISEISENFSWWSSAGSYLSLSYSVTFMESSLLLTTTNWHFHSLGKKTGITTQSNSKKSLISSVILGSIKSRLSQQAIISSIVRVSRILVSLCCWGSHFSKVCLFLNKMF